MKENTSYADIVSTLVSFGHRQFENELKAGAYIESVLKNAGIAYSKQNHSLFVPRTKKAVLKADGVVIPCRGNCFVSGVITDKDHLISNMYSSRLGSDIPNINFNPHNDGISESNHYQAPAFAISRKDVQKILEAKKIRGEVVVEKVKHSTYNILVGNTKNPEKIIFTHFDSVNAGAIDNASGVAVVLKTIIEKPELLEKHLFAICSSEELSYDKPVYWGAGYRVFEKKYLALMKKAKGIVVVDSVGHTKPELLNDPHLLQLGFPIVHITAFARKTSMLAGNIEKLMEVYHSDTDTGENIKETFMKETQKKLEEVL